MPLFTVQDIVRATRGALVAGVLGVRWNVLKPTGSFNNQWGLPLTLLRLVPEHAALVLELGTNRPGEIAYLAELARPTVGVVTNVAAVHTEFLGSLDGVSQEKAALVRAVPADGWVALNADDPRVARMARDTKAHVVTYGRAPTAHVRLLGDVVEDARGLAFTLEAAGVRQPATLAFAGHHNVTNALAAAAVGAALGFTLDEIARGLSVARPVAGRCVWRDAGGVQILDDAYNANPVSTRAALDTVAARRGPGRLVAGLGDMLELGGIAEEAHREIGRAVVTAGADELVGVGRLALLAVEAAREGGLAEARPATTL